MKITIKIEEQIKNLKSQNFNYRQIANKVGCSIGIVHQVLKGSHIPFEYKQKKARKKYVRAYEPNPSARRIVSLKIGNFKGRKKGGNVGQKTNDFTLQDVLNKIGGSPVCYLSGRPLDLTNRRSFVFDHVTPVDRNGDNSLNNLNIAHPDANRAKNNLLNDEFIQLCKDVLVHNGYECVKVEHVT
jgi:5-methylcytosine-specific restriction endonuclease McrA